MSYPEAIISGLVQGLTEFLPVSSSGHLVILHHYFGYQEPQILFDIFLHVGTLFAIIIYFWYDIINLFTKDRHLLKLILIGFIPTAIVGFVFKGLFEALFVDIKAVGFMLMVTAGFLLMGEAAARMQDEKRLNAIPLGWIRALIIGLVQGLAIIPGISRSGSTIASGLLLRLSRKEAIRFSFLLSIPAILGALLFQIIDTGIIGAVTLPMLVGAFFAFIIGLAAISILVTAVYKSRLKFFAIYCLLAGILVLVV
jgi:undecaprenyl-diphosphatase